MIGDSASGSTPQIERCSFNGQADRPGMKSPISDTAICDACLDLVRDILAGR